MLPWAWAVEKEPDHPVRMSNARHAGEGVLGWAHTIKRGIKASVVAKPAPVSRISARPVVPNALERLQAAGRAPVAAGDGLPF